MYFRGVDLSRYFNILDIRRNILPPQNIIRASIPGSNKSVFVKNENIESNIEVDIEIKGESKKDLRQVVNQLASKLHGNSPGKLIFLDEPDKYYLAILEGDTILKEFYVYGTTTLNFLLLDPVKYGKTVQTPINAGIQTIYNLGTYETNCKMIINVSRDIGDLKITKVDTGEFIYLNDVYSTYTFKAGDEILIDFENHVVKKNDYIIMEFLSLESDFFNLSVGANRIELSTESGKIEFVERWL